jgi:FHA domain
MLKCPFCNFHNEDGALFCEQCKSDLASVASAPAESPPAPALPEAVPMAAVIEELIPMAAVDVGVSAAPIAVAEVAAPAAPPMAVVEAAAPPAFPIAEAVAAASPAPAAQATPATPAADGNKLPTDAKPKLVVLRGQKINAEFPIYEGLNFIGRADEKPVDIDLEDQEPPDRVWCSRQHALISFEDSVLTIEDLNSANGTYVNRARIYPGQKRPLNVNDVIQIGTVQLKLKF